MPERPVAPHDHTRFSRGGKLSSAAITGLTTSNIQTGGGGDTGGGGSSDHGGLSGLGDDDHTQYRLDATWFDVTRYGATGDGVTNDTASINNAISALVAAGRGNLYFPAGTYITSGGLTTISVPATILGDGTSSSISGPNSKITCTSTTANLFNVTADGCAFRDIGLINTGGTATAGAGILSTGGELAEFESLRIESFFTGIDLENSVVWHMRGCWISDIRKYGMRIRNTAVSDAGDWAISDSWFGTTHPADAGLYINSSGGGKIVNCKFNGSTSTNRFTTGIDLAIGTGGDTSVLLIANCSIENVTTDAIRVTTTGTGKYGYVAVNGCQVGLYGNNAGRAVKLNAASTGGFVAGGIGDVVIDSCLFKTDGTARAAVELTNTDNVTLGEIVLTGFNARYTNSGGTNITDGSAVTYATPAIVLGTAAAAGAASSVIRSDSTIVAFDVTVPAAVGTAATGAAAVASRRDHVHPTGAGTPTTAAFGDAAATGSGPAAAMTDHRHGMPATPSGVGEILITDTPSTPLIFADLIQNEAQDDLVYAD